VADIVVPLLTDIGRMQTMTAGAALSGHRDAALQVAHVALEVAREGVAGRKRAR
jgi:UDP-N-acetylglucosamine--N-acetylmuramyl-(pentapeptide) pyrophosphoryl-undecaprenol N-acetylglucosamine transferase